LREAIGALTQTWSRLGHDIGFGIGIAHGFSTLGTIGFEGRFDYAAIGTVSNVASRFCDEAKPALRSDLIDPTIAVHHGARSRANVRSSSDPASLLYPTTSAARIAISLRVSTTALLAPFGY
jgi:class 3 adenylate cyclase